MGSLFSSEPERQYIPPPPRQYNYRTYEEYEYEPRSTSTLSDIYYGRRNTESSSVFSNTYNSGYNYTSSQRPSTYVPNNLTRNFENLTISAGSLRKVTPPKSVTINSNILNLRLDPYFSLNNVVTYIPLDEYDADYQLIKRKITNKRNFKLDSIEKIENPILRRAYELKKEQKRRLYGHVNELQLFHGTKRANVDNICKMNFNWRLCQTHKYGRGVSFSPNANYAAVYSDQYVHDKVMIVALVLVANSCIGNSTMVLPPEGYDTTKKGEDGIVIVKYEDNEFYPAFKINYHLRQETVRRQRRKGGINRNIYAVPTFDLSYSFD